MIGTHARRMLRGKSGRFVLHCTRNYQFFSTCDAMSQVALVGEMSHLVMPRPKCFSLIFKRTRSFESILHFEYGTHFEKHF